MTEETKTYMSVEELFAELERGHPWHVSFGFLLRRWRRAIRNFPRQIRWFIQRGRRGYSDADTWSLNVFMAGVLVGGIGQLRARAYGYPSELGSYKEWDAILAQMVEGFELFIEDDYFSDSEKEAKVREAFRLLGHWYGALWD